MVNNEFMTYQDLGRRGKLGNQLFQIASCIMIANRNGYRPLMPNWEYADWFSVPAEFFCAADCSDLEDVREIVRKTMGVKDPTRAVYLQDIKYWRGSEALVREFFTPSHLMVESLERSPTWEFISKFDSPIALHIRRGDYVGRDQFHPVLPMSYYEAALDRMKDTWQPVMVFSDDRRWCEKYLSNKSRLHLVPDDSELHHLFAMASLRHHIIANSTYSWWGAYLSASTSVVYPEPWFGWAGNSNSSGLRVPEWSNIRWRRPWSEFSEQ